MRFVATLTLVVLGVTMAADGDDGQTVELDLFAGGFTAPIMLEEAPDDSGRLLIVDQPGVVWSLDVDGEVADTPFLDIRDRIVDLDPEYDERGLLGLTLHPDFASNGRLFVYYSAPLRAEAPEGWDHTSHVSEFLVEGDAVDPDSERIVLQVDQPYSNHNAGQISFGPDGFLYVPLGDGGNGGDQDAAGEDRGRPEAGWAQTTSSLLGSVLRLDVDADATSGYAIPPDNPFVGDPDVRDEIFAYGFRNPYGLSFDLVTGDPYVTDAGQALYEEVDRVEAGGNYGWNIREGTHCFNQDDYTNPPESCPDTGARGEPLIDPVIEYRRGPDSGSVIVPGVLSRDESVPELEGRFVFGDYGSIRYLPTGVLYVATPQEQGLWPMEEVRVESSSLRPGGGLSRFLLGVDQDLSGRLYVLTTNQGGPDESSGEIYTIGGSATSESPAWLVPLVVGGALLIVVAALGIVWSRSRSGQGVGP